MNRCGLLELSTADRIALWASARRDPAAISRGHPALAARLQAEMRRMAGLERAGRMVNFIALLLGAGTDQGDELPQHDHREHVVILYPMATSLVVAGRDERVAEGEVVHLTPGTPHAVRPCPSPRLSIPMLVEVE